MRCSVSRSLACVSLLLTMSLPVQATVVVPAGVSELAAQAAAIAHGRVVRIDTQQGAGRRAERLVTVQVFDYLKGGLGNVVQIRLPGGTIGRYRTIMIGAPELTEGDEVVLFLGVQEGTGLPYLLGFHQGVYQVVTDPASGQRVVTPPLLQGAAAPSAGQAVPVIRGDVNRRRSSLDEFRNAILGALAAGRKP